MKLKHIFQIGGALGLLALAFTTGLRAATPAPGIPAITTVSGMPAVVQPENLYSEVRSDHFAPGVKDDLERVYVPNLRGHSVTVIDPKTLKVVDTFKVGRSHSTLCRPGTCAHCGWPTTMSVAITAA